MIDVDLGMQPWFSLGPQGETHIVAPSPVTIYSTDLKKLHQHV